MTQRKKDTKHGTGTGVETKDRHKVSPPSKYKIVLHNDDFTPMDFVSALIMEVFRKQKAAADVITLMIHHKGKGIVGTYPKEIAEMKVKRCHDYVKAYEHPLLITMEKE
jgi:ATP-dependent Clp protease adaptor protein ClpS|tara:strand:+ start:562 stop:888 length:327 start_codon:yes stop_codon:yes gene_type:complete